EIERPALDLGDLEHRPYFRREALFRLRDEGLHVGAPAAAVFGLALERGEAPNLVLAREEGAQLFAALFAPAIGRADFEDAEAARHVGDAGARADARLPTMADLHSGGIGDPRFGIFDRLRGEAGPEEESGVRARFGGDFTAIVAGLAALGRRALLRAGG